MTERRLGIAGVAAVVGLLAIAPAVPSHGPVLAQAPSPPSVPASQAPADQREANAPQDDQRPIFRGGTAFVAVDVYPRRDGRVVEGLTAADFEVTEDGKPQAVEVFQFIRFETALVDADRRDPRSITDAERQAADPRNRLFVVYLDPYNTGIDGGVNVSSTVMAFLTRTIGASDLFGVMTPELPPSQLTFGRRLETLESDLADFWRETQLDPSRMNWPRTPTERRLVECVLGANGANLGEAILVLHRQDVLMGSLEGLMHRLGGLKDERKNVLFISEGWVPRPRRPIGTTGGRGGVPPIGVGPSGRLGAGNQQPVGRDDTWCDGQYARLGSIDFEQRFRDLLKLARESNVAFYPVDVGGLRTGGGNGQRNTLLELAENTDGIAVTNTNDLTGGVRRLTDSIAAFYLLGYYSTNAATDGKYREIRVRIKQPNVAVSARPGYFAPTPAMLAAASAPAPPPPSAVDHELGRLARARPDADLHTYAVHAGGRLDVVAEMASRLLSSDSWKDGAEVRVTARSTTGPPVEAQGRIEPGLRSAIVPIALAAGDAGPWTITLRVTGGGELLEASASAAPPTGPLFGDPILYRANSSPRAVTRAVADLQYRRVERIHIEWRALKPLTGRTARLLDRQGRPLPITPTLSDRDAGGVTMVAADLALAPLQEGDYVIELTGTTATETERELLAFKVVR